MIISHDYESWCQEERSSEEKRVKDNDHDRDRINQDRQDATCLSSFRDPWSWEERSSMIVKV